MIPIQYMIEEEDGISFVDHTKAVLEAGCRWIIFCPYSMKLKRAITIAKKIKALCRSYDATFTIKDNIELVKAVEADGIFLMDYMSVFKVRQTLGEGFLIGTHSRSAHAISIMKQLGADYISTGPIDASLPDMVSAVAALTAGVRQLGIDIPITVYGSFEPDEVPFLIEAGVSGLTFLGGNDFNSGEEVKAYLEPYFKI